MNVIIITGSSGLIGSEVASFFHKEGFSVHGIDNNQRAVFFGPQGDTRWSRQRLERNLKNFSHHELDIRDRQGLLALIRELRPAGIIHCAAQPSHDRAAAIPFDDFDTNAVGTLNLLEAARLSGRRPAIVFTSTNKVYGGMEAVAVIERTTRYEYRDLPHGVPETQPLYGIDTKVSEWMTQPVDCAAPDLSVQEAFHEFAEPSI